jgi:hypothetical protein
MKKKTIKTTDMLDKLANAIEGKTLASNEIKQAREETAKIKSSLEEPVRKALSMQSEVQITRAKSLKIIEEAKTQESFLKSCQPTGNDPLELAKKKAMVLNRKLHPRRLAPL